jgi:serine/threonine protein kinase
MRENYTSKADIFSLGIMFFEIIYGKPPWNAKNPV